MPACCRLDLDAMGWFSDFGELDIRFGTELGTLWYISWEIRLADIQCGTTWFTCLARTWDFTFGVVR